MGQIDTDRPAALQSGLENCDRQALPDFPAGQRPLVDPGTDDRRLARRIALQNRILGPVRVDPEGQSVGELVHRLTNKGPFRST